MEKYEFSDDQYHVFTLYSLLCFSEQLYNTTMSRLDKINIYFNRSDIRFITSDDPCFNQKFEQEKFHVQIPISPKVMIELVQNSDEEKQQMIEYYKFHQENREYLMVNDYLINFYEIDEKEVVF
jgi:Uma2 family endonuclease